MANKINGKLVARKCSVTGEAMNQGWVSTESDKYFKYKKDALKYCIDNGYPSISKAFNDDFMYWTEWCANEDPCFVDIDGEIIELDRELNELEDMEEDTFVFNENTGLLTLCHEKEVFFIHINEQDGDIHDYWTSIVFDLGWIKDVNIVNEEDNFSVCIYKVNTASLERDNRFVKLSCEEFIKAVVEIKNTTETEQETIKDIQFPNGFTSWQETHYEIVRFFTENLNKEDEEDIPFRLLRILQTKGTGGLYELAEELTNKFEKENRNKNWDGDFFNAIEEFLTNELN